MMEHSAYHSFGVLPLERPAVSTDLTFLDFFTLIVFSADRAEAE